MPLPPPLPSTYSTFHGKPNIRRFQRFAGYDYSRGATLFITIATEPRRRCLSTVEGDKIHLTPLGRSVNTALKAIPEINTGLRLFNYIVMPDHIHLKLYLEPNLPEPLERLEAAIERFKNDSGTAWQEGFHDRICTSRRFADAVVRYIRYNPLKWSLRRSQEAFLALREPLASPRLSTDEFWRGIGNAEILVEEREMAAIRISRRVPESAFPEMLRRIAEGARKYTLIGGWISPGEIAARNELLRLPYARIVLLLPSQMPHGYMPSNLWFEALQQGRALIIARGNEEVEFSREACLDLNETASQIADLSLYWQADGAHFSRPGGGIK